VRKIPNGTNFRTKLETAVNVSVTQECGPRAASLTNGKRAKVTATKPKIRGNKKASVLRRSGKFGSGERTRSQKVLSDPSRLERGIHRKFAIFNTNKKMTLHFVYFGLPSRYSNTRSAVF